MSVIWFTGLSGAGKSTLARALRDALPPAVPVAILDGDDVRAAVGDGLGYAEADRQVQVGRLSRLAGLLANQDIVTIVAAVYASEGQLRWNREHLPDYFEVHLDASLDALRARDGKKLYERALRGDIANVVGVDIPAWRPLTPDLTLSMDTPEPPEVLARRVLAALPPGILGGRQPRRPAVCGPASRSPAPGETAGQTAQ